MKPLCGTVCILLRIGACIAAISPSLITVDQLVLENKLSESDSREVDNVENERLCRSEKSDKLLGTIDPDVNEDSKLRVVGSIFSFQLINFVWTQLIRMRIFQPELIKKYKYESEVHEVTTNDGYILQMHRITGGPKSPPQKGKTPVLLMHGLLDSSATWVIMRPNHGLGEEFQSTPIGPFCVKNRTDKILLFTIAYLLADQGYDVWMGNARGNTYSRRHVKLNPDGWRWQRKEFWSFSWHEIGVFDLPAMIDYVLAQSEKSKLHYIGHSQGTTAFFVMCSQRPEYNDKIIMMNALAPVAYAKHIKSPVVRAFTPFLYTLDVNFVVHIIILHQYH